MSLHPSTPAWRIEMSKQSKDTLLTMLQTSESQKEKLRAEHDALVLAIQDIYREATPGIQGFLYIQLQARGLINHG